MRSCCLSRTEGDTAVPYVVYALAVYTLLYLVRMARTSHKETEEARTESKHKTIPKQNKSTSIFYPLFYLPFACKGSWKKNTHPYCTLVVFLLA